MVKLNENLVFNRTKSSTDNVTRLNLWGCDVDDIELCSQMPNLTVLALSVNNVSNLEPLMHCENLEELYLRKNNIEDIQQINYLRPLKKLRTLWIDENPCINNENYDKCRLKVIATLPQLKMLDNRQVTKEELEKAAELGDDDNRSEPTTPAAQMNSQEENLDRRTHETPPSPRHPHHYRRTSSYGSDIDDDARLAVDPQMYQSMTMPSGANYSHITQPLQTSGYSLPQPHYHQQSHVPPLQLAQTPPISYGSYPHPQHFVSQAPTQQPQPTTIIVAAGGAPQTSMATDNLMTMSMHGQQAHQILNGGTATTQQQIMAHQNAINELMSSSIYQPNTTVTHAGHSSGTVPRAMTMSLMRPSFPSMGAIVNQTDPMQQEMNSSWTEFAFDDTTLPSLTPRQRGEECGSPVAPLTAPSTFFTQQQLHSRKRYTRSRSISPSRLQNTGRIVAAITNLLDELDASGLRMVIDEAQRRIKKQR